MDELILALLGAKNTETKTVTITADNTNGVPLGLGNCVAVRLRLNQYVFNGLNGDDVIRVTGEGAGDYVLTHYYNGLPVYNSGGIADDLNSIIGDFEGSGIWEIHDSGGSVVSASSNLPDSPLNATWTDSILTAIGEPAETTAYYFYWGDSQMQMNEVLRGNDSKLIITDQLEDILIRCPFTADTSIQVTVFKP